MACLAGVISWCLVFATMPLTLSGPAFAGNDIPVFFIRDGIKFPDLVHSLKPSPRKHVQEGWRVLDFLSHHPESCNIVRS